jgi:hypothetical protein
MLDHTLFQLFTWKPYKKELVHLCEIGALQPQGASKWSSPTFITPPKDGRIHWVSDLRELDNVVRCQQYSLPIIQDILRKCTGYKFFTKIDISMQYCTFELNEESKDLCTTFLHPLINLSATDCLWVLNVPLTLPKRLWETYLAMLLKWRSI